MLLEQQNTHPSKFWEENTHHIPHHKIGINKLKSAQISSVFLNDNVMKSENNGNILRSLRMCTHWTSYF